MSLRRRVLHRVGACLEDVTRLGQGCKNDQQRAELAAILDALSTAFKAADEARALGAAERRPKTAAFDFEVLAGPDDTLVVEPHRVASARVAASAWGKRHGVTLSVNKRPDGSAVIRLADDEVF